MGVGVCVKDCEVKEEFLEREQLLPLKTVKMHKVKGALVETVDQDDKCVARVCYFISLPTPSSLHAYEGIINQLWYSSVFRACPESMSAWCSGTPTSQREMHAS